MLLSDLAQREPSLSPRYEGGFDKLLSVTDMNQLSGLMGDRFEYTLEVGWGTVEISCGPCEGLHELRDMHESAVGNLNDSCKRLGMQMLGYGIQPRTTPSNNLMSPRR
jgi:gamma-glutamylcysteine synthetase